MKINLEDKANFVYYTLKHAMKEKKSIFAQKSHGTMFQIHRQPHYILFCGIIFILFCGVCKNQTHENQTEGKYNSRKI